MPRIGFNNRCPASAAVATASAMMHRIIAAPRGFRTGAAVIVDASADHVHARAARCTGLAEALEAVAPRVVAFAQIRAIGPARAGNPPRPEKYFRAGSGVPRQPCHVPRMHPGNPRMRRRARAAEKKCLKKSGFHATRTDLPRVQGRTAAPRAARTAKAIRPIRRRARKKICDKVLTAEKSVIRFRPADVSCRSE